MRSIGEIIIGLFIIGCISDYLGFKLENLQLKKSPYHAACQCEYEFKRPKYGIDTAVILKLTPPKEGYYEESCKNIR